MRVTIIAISVAVLFVAISLSVNSDRNSPRVIFCDVGQGDATYIRLPGSIDVLVDTGGNKSILTCLDNALPLFDRTIDGVFLTHPQKDHTGGLDLVLRAYTVKHIFVSKSLLNSAFDTHAQWKHIKETVSKYKIPIYYVQSPNVVRFGQSKMQVLWPDSTFRVKNIQKDINNSGLVLLAKIHRDNLFLPADVDYQITEVLLEKLKSGITVLKIGHHGSKTATSKKLLLLARPMLGVISVGKFNTYHHPSKEIIDLLYSLSITIKRTDEQGTIIYRLRQ